MEGYTISFQDGIATLTLKAPGRANTINAEFIQSIQNAFEACVAHEGLKGIILTSGHNDFCAGANIDMLFAARDPEQIYNGCRALCGVFRSIETKGIPVVAAINGHALGGGYELALACHHRIAINDGRIMVGLPEASLGVIPGAGGTQRLPYLIGLQAAMEHMAAGQPMRAPKAASKGFIDALADDKEQLLAMAAAWINENPKPTQPWDQKRYKWPGGVRPGTMEAKQLFVGASAFLYKKTAGVFEAPEMIIRAVAEGTCLTFDRGTEVESRMFAKLATSDQAKDMIRTLWYHRTAAEKTGVGLKHDFKKVTVLGAGMMGAGLGFLSAKTGCEVVIKDIKQEQLDVAIAHATKQARKLRHLDTAAQDAILDRITYTLENGPIAGSDLVIEAIVENPKIKHAVIREVEPLLAENAVFASNTSAIPIAYLAEAAQNKDRFIGMHFFSPVEKMPLLEIIQPPECSDDTLNRTLAFGKALKKTNIVVNDGYGFFTTRLFSAYLLEGCELLAEGHDAALIEYAARNAGMVMPPLKVFDEVSLALGAHGFETRKMVTGEDVVDNYAGLHIMHKLVDLGRTGKIVGKGFYDWDTRTVWPGLRDLVDKTPEVTGLEHIQRRLMIAQAAEIGRVLDDGIIRDNKDVEVGAIFGLGFAPNTGGPLAWIDSQGLRNLVPEMRDLASKYGERYAPSKTLVDMAERNETFWDKV